MGTKLAPLLERQHGRIARRQLLALGVTERQIARRVASGRLRRVHRGVYSVAGAPPSREALWMAAVLATGPDAVLSHRSAAELWAMIPGCSDPVHVSIPSRSGRNGQAGIVVHRPRIAAPATRTRGILVTTPLRTLRDIRPALGRLAFERAASECQRLHPATKAEIDGLLPHGAPTTNDFEQRFLEICRNHGIPLPRCQVPVAAFHPDFLWPDRKLIVETDGRDTHTTLVAFEDDRARDVELRVRGYTVLRFTWLQLTERPGWVAQTVLAALSV